MINKNIFEVGLYETYEFPIPEMIERSIQQIKRFKRDTELARVDNRSVEIKYGGLHCAAFMENLKI